MISRVAYLSLHTSPLLQPGAGDAGGMNVYLDELARTMAGRGVSVDVYTRRQDPDVAEVVEPASGYRVIHVAAGPPETLPIDRLPPLVPTFAEGVIRRGRREGYDLVHSHYWLSGWAGLLVKRALGIPLANSFHTLGRVKQAAKRPDEVAEPSLRLAAEDEVIGGSDCVIASTPYEAAELMEHYGADPTRLCVSPPGVNHDIFRPGPQAQARAALDLGPGPLMLFVGRLQPLKGVDVAVDALAHLRTTRPDLRLLVVGGPSGPDGAREVARLRERVARHGLIDAVRFVPPRPHHAMPTVYQAADVLHVPSRVESFGLVAAEAQACGLPVVAARVGGLAHVVADGRSGLLVDGHDPVEHAGALGRVLEDQDLRRRLSEGAVAHAERFSWDRTADRLLELYAGITGAAGATTDEVVGTAS